MEFDIAENPQPFFVPTRVQSFVKATDGRNLNSWLCLGKFRADELFQQEIAKYDPFVGHYGDLTAVKVFTGYGNPPHNPHDDY